MFTAPDTSEPPTVIVFLVNASVSVGSVPAATDDAVIAMSATATVATLNAAAVRTDLFISVSLFEGVVVTSRAVRVPA
jgi:hypothetical protein